MGHFSPFLQEISKAKRKLDSDKHLNKDEFIDFLKNFKAKITQEVSWDCKPIYLDELRKERLIDDGHWRKATVLMAGN